MKALVYLLGARALDAAGASIPAVSVSEVALAPMATTPEGAAAWRQWAAAAGAGPSVEPDEALSESPSGPAATQTPRARQTPAPRPAG